MRAAFLIPFPLHLRSIGVAALSFVLPFFMVGQSADVVCHAWFAESMLLFESEPTPGENDGSETKESEGATRFVRRSWPRRLQLSLAISNHPLHFTPTRRLAEVPADNWSWSISKRNGVGIPLRC